MNYSLAILMIGTVEVPSQPMIKYFVDAKDDFSCHCEVDEDRYKVYNELPTVHLHYIYKAFP